MLTVATRLGYSDVHGFGLFAESPINKGDLIWEYSEGFDLYVSLNDFEKMQPNMREFFARYGSLSIDQYYLMCLDNARFMNHSDDACIATVRDKCYAKRFIQIAEELTCDYREFDVRQQEWL